MASKSDKRSPTYNQLESGTERSRPILHQNAREIQPYGKIAKLPIALDEKVCAASAENLNQILADTITLRDLYKKHHWQVAGHTFYQLHLLFDKHHNEQDELVEAAEAITISSLWRVDSAAVSDWPARYVTPPVIRRTTRRKSMEYESFPVFLTPMLAVTSWRSLTYSMVPAPEILRRGLILDRNQSRFTAGQNRSSQGVSILLLKEPRLPAKKSE